MAEAAFTPFAALRQRLQDELPRRVPAHLARMGWSADQLASRQRDGLRALLAIAKQRSPFHAARLRDVDPASFELADLARLPILTKAQLMGAFDDAVTDRRLTRALAERALAASSTEPQPLFGEWVCLVSGGSSGMRGVFVLDLEAAVEFYLCVNRTPMRRSLAAGGLPPGGITVAVVAAGAPVHATAVSSAWTGSSGPVRSVPVPATLPVDEIVARLNALAPTAIVGYPSALARLAREQRAGRLHIAPTAVTCTSENLLPPWRAAIAAAFGAPITNGFGSTEGLVGMSEPDDEPFVFNSDVCIVELVDASGRPVPPGVPSARILLTNLANHAQPLIRYEIDDRFVQAPPDPAHGHLRARVDGRSADVLRLGGRDLHPLTIGTVLMAEADVLDYRVRYAPARLDLEVVAGEGFDGSALVGAVQAALVRAAVGAVEISITRVPAIAPDPATGKTRRFVPA